VARLTALLLLVFMLGLLLGGCGSGKNRKITPNLTQRGTSSVPAGGQSGQSTTSP
jgi:uncharacterized protein YceK